MMVNRKRIKSHVTLASDSLQQTRKQNYRINKRFICCTLCYAFYWSLTTFVFLCNKRINCIIERVIYMQKPSFRLALKVVSTYNIICVIFLMIMKVCLVHIYEEKTIYHLGTGELSIRRLVHSYNSLSRIMFIWKRVDLIHL